MAKQRHRKASASQQTVSSAPIPLLQSRAFSDNEQLLIAETPQAEMESKPDGAILGHSLAHINTRPLSHLAIQPKLTIGKVGDPYEQEADQVAAQVVQRINAPQSPANNPAQTLQRETQPEEEELQMKPLATLQRQELPEEELQMKPVEALQRQEQPEEELQMKPVGALQRQELPEEELQMKPVQRQEAVAGGDASTELESAINSGRGGGQPLEAGLQRQMGQAMGADFSGVKVHTDGQADQLNRSIQAKAFTTKQDVFFRQGAYNPGSQDGQELIAHELTHVVQQNGGAVQRTPSIQAAFEDAYLNDTAQLHNIDPQSGKDKGTISGGKKFKTGDLIKADSAQSLGSGAWLSAQAGGKMGYVRATKVVFKSSLAAPSDPSFETDKAEQGQEIADRVGGGTDSVAGGLEQSFLKEAQNGRLQDRDDSQQSHGSTKTGFDIAAGTGDTLTGLFGMVASASKIVGSENKLSWDNLEAGYGFVESLGKSTSGATKIVDSIAKASGAKDGVGKSDVAGKITGAIADGLGAVKNAALGIIGIYRLFKSQSSEKGKDALVTLKNLTDAAGSAAKVAKSAYDIIGNGIPMSIIYAVPALSIGVSAINLLIRLWDAFVAGKTKGTMSDESTSWRIAIANALGDPVPTEDTVSTSKLFDPDRRGTFPNYKTYFRTKKGVREAIKQIVAVAQERSNNLGNVPRIARQERAVAKRAHNAVTDQIGATGLDGTHKDKLKALTGEPKTVAEFQEKTVTPLQKLDETVDTYEYADKMSEINQKRQTSGWTDVILEIVSMAGDITTIAVGATGIGAAIGQGVKAASAGYKMVHGGAKFVQKLYRNSGDGSDKKSSTNKHKEYTQHARFIYQQIANLKPQDTAKEKQLESYIRATGVNYGMWLTLRYNPQSQVEMMVEAMKQR